MTPVIPGYEPSAARVGAGRAVDTRPALALYDAPVLGLSDRFAWRCPPARLRVLDDAHVGAAHPEAGVGTGYFLDRCRFPGGHPRLVLPDPNRNRLEAPRRRVRRRRPLAVRADLRAPLPPGDATSGPVALNRGIAADRRVAGS